MSSSDLPQVSVVVPVRDAAGDIGRLLEALMNLDWPQQRLERIVVDNASTDATRDVVRRQPVTLLQETGTLSSYAARNRGIAAARGEWIAFTDADCAPQPDWLRQLLTPPPAPQVGAVAGEVLALEGVTAVQRLVERYGVMKHSVTLPHKALPCFSTANVAVRRELLQRVKGFREDVRYFGDMELSWRLQLETGARLEMRPDAVVRHRHRRTWRALWRQGCQHGRGVAFMQETYPRHYRISAGEQFQRLGELLRSLGRAVAGGEQRGAPATGRRDPDRFAAPLFMVLWYGGMLTGYLLGPARSRGAASDPRRAAPRHGSPGNPHAEE